MVGKRGEVGLDGEEEEVEEVAGFAPELRPHERRARLGAKDEAIQG